MPDRTTHFLINPWIWKVLLFPAFLLSVFGILGLLYPSPYMDYYLRQTASTTAKAVEISQPRISLLLEVIFRANGLGMIMSGILAIFIICFAVRKGNKWAIPALAIAGGIGLLGEIILEIMVFR
jgi:hypothetical protein